MRLAAKGFSGPISVTIARAAWHAQQGPGNFSHRLGLIHLWHPDILTLFPSVSYPPPITPSTHMARPLELSAKFEPSLPLPAIKPASPVKGG